MKALLTTKRLKTKLLGLTALFILGIALPASAATTFTATGTIQTFTVPTTGTYTIDAAGAQGGNVYNGSYTGGTGARLHGDFTLTQGTQLSILVGSQPQEGYYASGGGGGSYVYIGSTPYLIAGGGGGAGYNGSNGKNASTSQSAVQGYDKPTSTIGTGGTSYDGGGGAGWQSNGTTGTYGGGGKSPSNNGSGGSGYNTNTYNGYQYAPAGGFGGGGGGGGGGDWEGGGGGGYTGGPDEGGAAGSYNNGTNQGTGTPETGNGTVVITFQAPGTTTFIAAGAIQTFTVPTTGTYTIDAAGAQGGNDYNSYTGGTGARLHGDFTLTQGTQLSILVGSQPQEAYCASGGGGGSYVYIGSTPYLIAGGGGGGGNDAGAGKNASTSQSAVQGYDKPTSTIGTGGTSYDGGGGAGWQSNGTTGTYGGGGNSPSNNGSGGSGFDTSTYNGYQQAPAGGFGGGGGGGYWGGGGGGGYTGGPDEGGAAGSYNNGTNQGTGTPETGDGIVIITLKVSPPTTPTNIIPSNITPNTITLSWTAGVNDAAYNIYKNSIFLGTSTTTSYPVTSLQQSTNYSFTVTGYNNPVESTQSLPCLVTTTQQVNSIQTTDTSKTLNSPIVLTDGTNYYDPIAKQVYPLTNIPGLSVAHSATEYTGATQAGATKIMLIH